MKRAVCWLLGHRWEGPRRIETLAVLFQIEGNDLVQRADGTYRKVCERCGAVG